MIKEDDDASEDVKVEAEGYTGHGVVQSRSEREMDPSLITWV